MNFVDADLNKLAAMAENDQGEAVVMLNLLKYRDAVSYTHLKLPTSDLV